MQLAPPTNAATTSEAHGWGECNPVSHFEDALRVRWTLADIDVAAALVPLVEAALRRRRRKTPTLHSVRRAIAESEAAVLEERARQVLHLLVGAKSAPMLTEEMLREAVEAFSFARPLWRGFAKGVKAPPCAFCLARIARTKGWRDIEASALAGIRSRRALVRWEVAWDEVEEAAGRGAVPSTGYSGE
jgi:hypothetical protein